VGMPRFRPSPTALSIAIAIAVLPTQA
jgi:hypothetical protein